MEEDPYLEGRKVATTRLPLTTDFANVKVLCGARGFLVQGHRIWPRSRFFAAAYYGEFKEADGKCVELPEEEPFIVLRMIQYFNTDKYSEIRIPASDTEPEAEDTWISQANTNVQVYALAEKYEVPDLKKLAQDRIEQALMLAHKSLGTSIEEEILSEIPFIYNTTPDSDRGLRNPVLEYVQKNWVRLSESRELKNVFVEAPMFGIELVTAMNQPCMYKGTCRRCGATDKWTAQRVRCLCGWAETVLGAGSSTGPSR